MGPAVESSSKIYISCMFFACCAWLEQGAMISILVSGKLLNPVIQFCFWSLLYEKTTGLMLIQRVSCPDVSNEYMCHGKTDSSWVVMVLSRNLSILGSIHKRNTVGEGQSDSV